MSTKELKPNRGANTIKLSNWMPVIVPRLKARWATALADLPANQATPNISDWLALLHAAAVAPQKVPHYLSHLLHHPKSGTDIQQGWATLAKLFAVTFEAAQTEGHQIDSQAWRNLLEIQNRVLHTAATVALVRPKRPTTDILARRALYLQTITELNKKIFVIWDSKELLDEVVSLLQRNFNYEYISLFGLDSAKQTLTLQSALWKNQRPNVEDFPPLKVDGKEVTARAAATEQVVLVNDLSQMPDFLPYPALPQTKSQLAVPLLADDHLLGILDIASDQVDIFSGDDRQILQALVSYIAVAIENARLQNTLQRHMREQKLLYESNIALGISLDSEAVLRLVTQKMTEAIEAGACVICKFDEKTTRVTALAEYVTDAPGNPPHTWRSLNTPISVSQDPVSQQVFKTDRPVIGRATPNKTSNWQQLDPSAEHHGWGTILALPLKIKQQITGIIEIYDQNPKRLFSLDDVELCQSLALQATLALERAQHFDEMRRRLNEVSTLYTMAQKIAGNLNLQEVLDAIVVGLRQVIGCRGCCIFLLDQSGERLEIKAADGLKPQWRKMAKLRLGQGTAGLAVAQEKTLYVPDTYQDPDFIFFDKAVRSLMVTPLTANGEIIGTINVDATQPNAFGPAQEQLLTIAAAQVGIAIENARLFTKISTEQQQTQTIIQHMADGLLVIDGEGTVVTCNSALNLMLNLPRDQIVGQKVGSPELHPNLASITATTTQRARTGVLAKEVTVETPNPKILQIFSTIMIDDNKNPIGEVRVVHDVTKERQLEQLKTDFMSTISHELRTPLFSIQGFAQLLLEDEGELEEATRTEFLTTIHTQAVQLGEMVNNLLDLSKFDEDKLALARNQVIVLNLLHQTSRKLQGFAHQRKINLSCNLPDSLPPILGDPDSLEQVVTNLLGNAIKFTKEGGHVSLTASASDTEILVEIKDDGMGIPPDALERIFSRYYQVPDTSKESTRGTGLGLHIAKKIVEGHGGRIWAESSLDQGSTFRFTLPLPDEVINHR